MKIQVWVPRFIEVNRTATQRIAKCEANNLCMACLEPLDATRTVRHCHERCARATYRAIVRGECTDEERVAEGKWQSPNEPGRKPSNPVTIELRK